MTPHFLGLNNFVWWFGIVENRLDPLQLGRCQVRCFGWHSKNKADIATEDLPWAHPVVPYGVNNVQPPTEGTMVFGLFADGKEARYPIVMGTVPGVPEELLDREIGFADPLSVADKRNAAMPRKLSMVGYFNLETGEEVEAKTYLGKNTKGIQIVEENPSRYPKYLNEPTTSRLARPVRGKLANGQFSGVTSESIAGTTIDLQRKTTVTGIPTAAGDQWDETYPAYQAEYPYNHVIETESGHAFEMDDTYLFERVQLSHRTGSTLEFSKFGKTKIKSMSSRQDITMGDQRTYVNGDKYETIDGDYYLQVGGKLRITAKSIEIVSGSSTAINAPQGIDIAGGTSVSVSGLSVGMSGVMTSVSGVKTDISGKMSTTVDGGVVHVQSPAAVVTKGPLVQTEAEIINNQGVESMNSCIPNPIPDPVPNPEIPKPGLGQPIAFADATSAGQAAADAFAASQTPNV